MVSAKVMRAQYLYLPIARTEAEKEIAYWKQLENGMSDEELDGIVSKFKSPKTSKGYPEEADIFQMALSGKMGEFVKNMRRENMIVFISCRHYLESKGEVPPDSFSRSLDNTSIETDPNLKRENIAIADKVQRVIKTSSATELRQILVDHLPAVSWSDYGSIAYRPYWNLKCYSLCVLLFRPVMDPAGHRGGVPYGFTTDVGVKEYSCREF